MMHFKYKDMERLNEMIEKIQHGKSKQQVDVASLASDKLDFRTRSITRAKEGHFKKDTIVS